MRALGRLLALSARTIVKIEKIRPTGTAFGLRRLVAAFSFNSALPRRGYPNDFGWQGSQAE
jgi:hypothetical protein